MLPALHDALADAVVLEMIPHQLVRVELGRVRRQEEEPQPAPGRLDEVAHFLRAMSRVAVDDQEDASTGTVE